MDFNVTIIDNGDHRVFIQAHLSNKKSLDICCNMYEPEFNPCHIMIGGSGSASYLKKIKI